MAANLLAINYFGDINIEHGGIFYRLDTWAKWGYQDVLRVVPASDAGCADNCYWIDHLVVNKPNDEQLASIFKSCGLDPELGTPADMVIESCMSYGHYEQHSSEIYQIGFKQSEYGEHIDVCKDHILRGNTDLRRFALRKFREYC